MALYCVGASDRHCCFDTSHRRPINAFTVSSIVAPLYMISMTSLRAQKTDRPAKDTVCTVRDIICGERSRLRVLSGSNGPITICVILWALVQEQAQVANRFVTRGSERQVQYAIKTRVLRLSSEVLCG